MTELRMDKSKGGCHRMPGHHVPAGGNGVVATMLSSELILHLDPS